MVLEQRLNILNKIYGLYNDVAKNPDVACKKYCSACCTPNVTMTTLEGYLIADRMVLNGQADLFENIQAKISKNRFKPQITTNRLADLCMKGDDPPEEEKTHSKKSCPVLNDNLCPIYEVRPFGCRCFISTHDCSKAGYAEVDPFDLTVSTLFMQFVEHIDFMGFSGNFADILLLMASKENRDHYKMNILNHRGADLIPNLKIKVLMVPPEHRMKVKPVLEALLSIKES
jgi:Fe-S-cluster containining protein